MGWAGQDSSTSCFLFAGTSSGGVKFRGELEVNNLSEENDMDELDVSLCCCCSVVVVVLC